MKGGGRRDGGTRGRLILAFVFFVPLSPCPPVPLFAQDSPAIVAAVRLAAEGRSDSARRVVAAQLARARPTDALYAEALYWRGRLAANADSAERDLRRVAIEFSTSRWADDAMLQLAQLMLASGNAAATLGYTQRLRVDHPGSDLRASAAYWGGRAAFEAGETLTACALLDSARAEAPGDIEFQNQVAFYRARCTAVARGEERGARSEERGTAPTDTAPRPSTLAPAPTPPAAPTPTPAAVDTPRSSLPAPRASGWEVQVAAARSEAAAQAVVDRLARNSQTARIIAGSDGYFRVRLGPYPTMRDAQNAAILARRVVTDRPFVVRP